MSNDQLFDDIHGINDLVNNFGSLYGITTYRNGLTERRWNLMLFNLNVLWPLDDALRAFVWERCNTEDSDWDGEAYTRIIAAGQNWHDASSGPITQSEIVACESIIRTSQEITGNYLWPRRHGGKMEQPTVAFMYVLVAVLRSLGVNVVLDALTNQVLVELFFNSITDADGGRRLVCKREYEKLRWYHLFDQPGRARKVPSFKPEKLRDEVVEEIVDQLYKMFGERPAGESPYRPLTHKAELLPSRLEELRDFAAAGVQGLDWSARAANPGSQVSLNNLLGPDRGLCSPFYIVLHDLLARLGFWPVAWRCVASPIISNSCAPLMGWCCPGAAGGCVDASSQTSPPPLCALAIYSVPDPSIYRSECLGWRKVFI